MRIVKPARGERFAEIAPTSKQLLEMADLSIADRRAVTTADVGPAPDTFVFLDNPWDALVREDS
jgi:hypothetical protein